MEQHDAEADVWNVCRKYTSFKVQDSYVNINTFAKNQWSRNERARGTGIAPPTVAESNGYIPILDDEALGVLCVWDEFYIGANWWTVSTGSNHAVVWFDLYFRPREIKRQDLMMMMIKSRCSRKCQTDDVIYMPDESAECIFDPDLQESDKNNEIKLKIPVLNKDGKRELQEITYKDWKDKIWPEGKTKEELYRELYPPIPSAGEKVRVKSNGIFFPEGYMMLDKTRPFFPDSFAGFAEFFRYINDHTEIGLGNLFRPGRGNIQGAILVPPELDVANKWPLMVESLFDETSDEGKKNIATWKDCVKNNQPIHRVWDQSTDKSKFLPIIKNPMNQNRDTVIMGLFYNNWGPNKTDFDIETVSKYVFNTGTYGSVITDVTNPFNHVFIDLYKLKVMMVAYGCYSPDVPPQANTMQHDYPPGESNIQTPPGGTPGGTPGDTLDSGLGTTGPEPEDEPMESSQPDPGRADATPTTE